MTIPDIPDGQTILLDTSVLIYYLENHKRYGQKATDCLMDIENGRINGVISTLVFSELLVPLFRVGDKKTVSGLVSRLTNFRNLAVYSVDQIVGVAAARLRAAYGFRTPDAIHAATAISANAQGILTNDKQMRRLEKENLNIWIFDDLT